MVPTTQQLTVIFFYLAAGVLTSSAESPFKFESTPGKLPKDVVPRHYAIRLQPDLERFVTTGKVDINIEVLKPAREIVLNALDMEITRAAITYGGFKKTGLIGDCGRKERKNWTNPGRIILLWHGQTSAPARNRGTTGP